MAKVSIYLDARRARKDGTGQLCVRVCVGRSARMVPLGLYVRPEDWDAGSCRVAGGGRLGQRLNVMVGRARAAAEEAALGIGLMAGIEDAVSAIRRAVIPDDEQSEGGAARVTSLVEAARLCQGMKRSPSTAESYGCLIVHIVRYCGDVALGDVTPGWLAGLDASMAKTARSANARGIYMRNLRAVFNYAIGEGWTANYPFRRFRIRTVPTAKRSLGVERLRRLLTMDVEDWQRPYRDFFALSFFMLGANAKDLLLLPVGADAAGRVEYNRAKTRKLYSVLIEPEAREIIERWRGERHMLSMMDGREGYKQFVRQCNRALGSIGSGSRPGRKADARPLFPGVTTYWARHSWATIAAELDVPKETIAAALGHDMGNMTSAIYIDFNRRKVDEANRRVIDYVLYGRR